MAKQGDLFSKFTEQFEDYHLKNPQIYVEFKRKAFQAINKGKKHYSAKAIFEVIRWETSVEGDGEYKVNNNFTAYFARLFEKEYPKHKGFFRMKKSQFDD